MCLKEDRAGNLTIGWPGTMDNAMADSSPSCSAGISRRVLRLQAFTILWMAAEAAISLVSAGKSHSPALLAFGGDSMVELLSAAVVFWRFRVSFNEARAARIAGTLLFVLAGLVALASVLNFFGYREARQTKLGMGILLAAAIVMPWLGRRKRHLAAATSSAALRADAAESSLCGYMAWIALSGLAVNAIWHRPWADPVAALAVIPLILREGWEAVHASRVGCSCPCK